MARNLGVHIVISDVRPVPGSEVRPGAVNARFQYDLQINDGKRKKYTNHFPGCLAFTKKPGTVDFIYSQHKGTGGTVSANKDMRQLVKMAINGNADILRIVKPPDPELMALLPPPCERKKTRAARAQDSSQNQSQVEAPTNL